MDGLTEDDRINLGPGYPVLLRYPDWSEDQFARLYILLRAQALRGEQAFFNDLDLLFNSADTAELETLYRCLPYLNNPAQFNQRAREGARSNLIPVFKAVAYHNPFPQQFFDEAGWNQLVLKAVFNSCPLNEIVGIDDRANPALAKMLCDYVRERWVAKRTVQWDIWRGIVPFVEEVAALDLVKLALESSDDATRLASGLGIHSYNSLKSREIIELPPDIAEAVRALSWQDLAQQFQ